MHIATKPQTDSVTVYINHQCINEWARECVPLISTSGSWMLMPMMRGWEKGGGVELWARGKGEEGWILGSGGGPGDLWHLVECNAAI